MDLNVYPSYAQNCNTHYGEQPFFKKIINCHQQCLLSSQAVSEFYQLEISDQQQPIFVIPDGCIDILFECDHTHPTARICGSTLDMQHVPLRPNISYFGVRFSPSIIPNFIQASAEDIFNNSINFTDVVQYGHDFISQITNTTDIQQQIHLFLSTFSHQLKRNFSAMTEYVIQAILQGNTELKIKSLEEKTGYCSRHIQRVFKQDVGISIKAFSCIMRFQSAIHALTGENGTKLSDLTYDLGYNDQAHFHKEFKKFSNMSPSGFIKNLHNYC